MKQILEQITEMRQIYDELILYKSKRRPCSRLLISPLYS